MTQFFLIITLIISTANLVFALLNCWQELSKRSVGFLFWFTSLYFAVVPVFGDAFMMNIGIYDAWENVFARNDVNWFSPSKTTLFTASIFIFVFNILYSLGSSFFRKIFRTDQYSRISEGNVQDPELHPLFKLFAVLITLFPGLYLWRTGYNFTDYMQDGQIMNPHIGRMLYLCPLSAAFAYVALIHRKYAQAFFFLIGIIIIGITASARFYTISIFSVCTLAWLHYSTVPFFKRRSLWKITIVICILAVFFVFQKRFSSDYVKKTNITSDVLKLTRDVASRDMYYCFSLGHDNPHSTHGKAIVYTLTTGIPREWVFGDDADDAMLMHILWQYRINNIEYGSLHPTVYGWSFFDLGYYGIFISLFVAFAVEFLNSFCKYNIYLRAFGIALIGVFVFTAMRGSFSIAYIRVLYGLICGGIILLLMLHFQKKPDCNRY